MSATHANKSHGKVIGQGSKQFVDNSFADKKKQSFLFTIAIKCAD